MSFISGSTASARRDRHRLMALHDWSTISRIGVNCQRDHAMTTTVEMKVQRANCFKLLAACFYEPDKELFLQEGVCDNLTALLAACHSAKAAMAATMMKKALEEQSEETLQVEYARLFVGPFELAAPPYGSVYLEGNRRLMGDSTLAVRKMYQEHGLTLDVKEVPDHIALELEFMHYLCLREANAEAKTNTNEANRLAEAQSDFMENFLGPWLAEFCTAIRNTTESPFYRHLADCLEGVAAKTSPPLEMAGPVRGCEVNHANRVSA